MPIRKFILQLLVFGAIALLCYPLIIGIWGFVAHPYLKPNIVYPRGGYGHMLSRMQEVKNTRDVDILFLGSSHAYRGFDARLYEKEGWKVFNMGSNIQSPLQTRVLLDRYLDQLNPRLVVIEVYPGAFKSDGVESSIDLIANDEKHADLIGMALKVNHIKTYNTLMFGFIRELILGEEEQEEQPSEFGDTYVAGGYVEKELNYWKYEKYPNREWEIKDTQWSAFLSNLETLKAGNYPFVLVYAPITDANYKSYTNQPYLDSLFSNQGKYFDFNKSLSLDDSLHFFDGHHLNTRGVEIMNREMIRLIKSEDLLAN